MFQMIHEWRASWTLQDCIAGWIFKSNTDYRHNCYRDQIKPLIWHIVCLNINYIMKLTCFYSNCEINLNAIFFYNRVIFKVLLNYAVQLSELILGGNVQKRWLIKCTKMLCFPFVSLFLIEIQILHDRI